MPDQKSNELTATGERLMPGLQQGELVVAEHFARYRWASAFVPGKAVLDAASGEGYGTDQLAAAGAASVIGVDIAADAVAHAAKKYGHDYRQGDVTALPVDDASLDVVVSFETIEHVADPAAAIKEFRRVLRPDGVLVISTPNAAKYTVENEFHVKELSRDEFTEVLGASFANVRLHPQPNLLTSLVLDEDSRRADGSIDLEFHADHAIAPGEELYILAVCSDAELPASPRPVAFASSTYEAHELADRVVNAEHLVGEWNARALEAERQLDAMTERAVAAERKHWNIVRWLPWNGIPRVLEKRREKKGS